MASALPDKPDEPTASATGEATAPQPAFGPTADTPPPRVSVLMTTFNGAAFIRESIDSVLAQTFSDFELVIVDDGSTDATPALLASCRDPRVRVIRPDRNLGVVGARNFGLAACRGLYIAAHDHDDLSLPERLATQVRTLDARPDIVLAGSEVLLWMADGRRLPTDHVPGATPALVRWMLHVDNPFTYSSIMVRADALRRLGVFMLPEAEPADDFDLYHRLLGIGPLARLDETLVIYRWHASNTTHAQAQRMADRASAILARAYAPWLGREADAAARLVVHHLSDRQPVRDAATLTRLGGFLERILAGFLDQQAPDAAARTQIEAHAGRVWWRLVRSAIRSGAPLALTQHVARRTLRREFTLAWHDVVASVAVGSLRAAQNGRIGRRLRGG
jgi:GT2 family glycosyltransferase